MKRSRGVLLLLVAGSSACILFGVDDLTGGGDAGVSDGATDAFATDAPVDAAPSDSSTDAGAAPFSCESIDATFCDDFNRDAAIVPGAPWNTTVRNAGCTLTVDGTLVSTFDASATVQSCLLISNLTSNASHFTLDFDMSFVTDSSSSAAIIVAEVTVNAADAQSAALYESFQLLVVGNGASKVSVQEYYPDAASSPLPGNQDPRFPLATASPFAQASPACHITLDVDALTPAAKATATCGKAVSTTTSVTNTAPAGFAGPAKVSLGFVNPDVPAPPWSINYDNMVFRALP